MFQIMKKVFPIPVNYEHGIWCKYDEPKTGGELVRGYTASDFLFCKVCVLHFCVAILGVIALYRKLFKRTFTTGVESRRPFQIFFAIISRRSRGRLLSGYRDRLKVLSVVLVHLAY